MILSKSIVFENGIFSPRPKDFLRIEGSSLRRLMGENVFSNPNPIMRKDANH
jgi:hypothetical protein